MSEEKKGSPGTHIHPKEWMGRENVRCTYCVESLLPRLTQAEHEQFENQAKHERKTHDDEQPMSSGFRAVERCAEQLMS